MVLYSQEEEEEEEEEHEKEEGGGGEEEVKPRSRGLLRNDSHIMLDV